MKFIRLIVPVERWVGVGSLAQGAGGTGQGAYHNALFLCGVL